MLSPIHVENIVLVSTEYIGYLPVYFLRLRYLILIEHGVYLFLRDADETKDWMEEKEATLQSDDFGHDLATVQRLQRKHEGLERDLAAIGEKVKELDETANRLMMTHPDQAQSIYDHQKEINDHWNQLTQKADDRKAKLLDSYDFQRFLSDERDLMSWINSMMALVSSDELAKDVTGAEALLERHQVLLLRLLFSFCFSSLLVTKSNCSIHI